MDKSQIYKFRSAVMQSPDNEPYFPVSNPMNCIDFEYLIGSTVLVNKIEYKVLDVKHFNHPPPFIKGESIGLIVDRGENAK